MVVGHTRSPHLADIGLHQIQVAFSIWFRRGGGPFRESTFEAFQDFGAHLITALANTRPNRGQDIVWFGAEISAHLMNGAGHNFRGGPAPSRMHSPKRAQVPVQQKNGYAIRCPNTDARAGVIGNQCVALPLTIFQSVCIHDDVRMDLPESHPSDGIRVACSETV